MSGAEERKEWGHPTMVEEFRTAVRSWIGDGHERYSDEAIDAVFQTFRGDVAPESVARRLLRMDGLP